MRVIYVVPRVSEENSGPAYSVPMLARAVAGVGVSVELHMLGPRNANCGDIPVRSYPEPSNHYLRYVGWSRAMRQGLREAAWNADIMHSNSLWMFPNIYPADAVQGTRCKLVVAPRGAFSEWAWNHSRERKRIMWWLGGQRRAVHAADCLHATSDAERVDLRRRGLKQPVIVLPIGIDVPDPLPPRDWPQDGARTLLFLSRIHATKGLDLLLRIWKRVGTRFSDWTLRIVGVDDRGHRAGYEGLGMELGVERVHFSGPVYGSAKWELLRSADLMVLPTHSENFGIVVAEALACEVPVVVSKGAPWEGVATRGCGWWVERNEDAFSEALADAMSRPRDELTRMGEIAARWMRNDFSWPSVGRRMNEAYCWLIGGGQRPDCVAVD